jgi:hypothetical protein
LLLINLIKLHRIHHRPSRLSRTKGARFPA